MPELLTFKTRLRGDPVWEMVEFLLNGFAFILIGLQLGNQDVISDEVLRRIQRDIDLAEARLHQHP